MSKNLTEYNILHFIDKEYSKIFSRRNKHLRIDIIKFNSPFNNQGGKL